MSEDTAAPADAAAAPAAKPAKSGGMMMIVLPAMLAAGGAFGGAKIAAAHAGQPQTVEVKVEKAPGPTMALAPFLVMSEDDSHKVHPIKLTLAVEFDAKAKEEETKELQPRVRDAVLTYLRTAAFDDLTDPKKTEKTRAEILEKIKASGAEQAQRILITDFVVQ
ncbi:MAG: flagellar basal body-associated FliL family protein [Polyangiaceae bacterium]